MSATEREMLDRLNVRYGKTYRNGAYVGRQFSRAEHVHNTSGTNLLPGDKRIADYIAVDSFQSRELTAFETFRDRPRSIHGHEIKVSRADWLAELRDPSKADAWIRHCHYWWLVAPADVVRDDLPYGWGLMVPHGKSLRVAVQATRGDVEPMTTSTVAALLRATIKTEVANAVIAL